MHTNKKTWNTFKKFTIKSVSNNCTSKSFINVLLLKIKIEFAVHINQKLNQFKIHKHEVIIQKLISFEVALIQC